MNERRAVGLGPAFRCEYWLDSSTGVDIHDETRQDSSLSSIRKTVAKFTARNLGLYRSRDSLVHRELTFTTI